MGRARPLASGDVPVKPNVLERFWAKVDRSAGPGHCWPWRGALTSNGYGSFRIGGKTYKAHRLAVVFGYEGIQAPRDLPAGLVACHQCDCRSCCNPGHLEPGGESRNLLEAYARYRRPKTPHSLFRWRLLQYELLEGETIEKNTQGP